MIELTASDGHKFSAYRAEPSATPKGSVVILPEPFGVNPHIRKIADRFAADGYLVVAPSLFDRVRPAIELGYDENDVAQGTELVNQIGIEGPISDIQASVDSVADAGKVAIVGYSWGGQLAYLAANRVNGVACAVGYYGTGIVNDPGAKRKIPTLLHFAEDDTSITSDELIQFRAKRPDVSAFLYPSATHGFNCDERGDFNAEAADTAMQRTLSWISQYVEGAAPAILKNAGSYAQAKTEKKKKKKADADDMGPPMD